MPALPDLAAPAAPPACVQAARRLPMLHVGGGGSRLRDLGGPDTPANHATCPLNDITYPPIRLLGATEAHPLGQDFLWSGSQLWRPRYREGQHQGRSNEVYGRIDDLNEDPLINVLPRVVFLQPLNRAGDKPRPLTPFPVELTIGCLKGQHPLLDLERHSEFNWNGLPLFNVLPTSSEVSARLIGRRHVTDATRTAAGVDAREDEQLWRRLRWEENHRMLR
eukprot:GHVU01153146.1.p1 GENE.GHVU01153146.1~~GHVU01153146.1.p1  ORF type:complete len:228 (-),score=7.85 GHVU01153146.1:400-1062(-)